MASFDCMISTVLIRIPFQVVREKNERKKKKDGGYLHSIEKVQCRII